MPVTLAGLWGQTRPEWSAAYGARPVAAAPLQSARTAIRGNIENLNPLLRLAGNINQFGAAQAAGQYAANLPGYSSMLQQSSANIGRRLAGDVSDMFPDLAQYAAERGVATGQAEPSANVNAALLRALGLSKYQVQREAEGDLTQAIGRTPTAPLFNVASMLVSPEEEQAATQAANLYASAPIPQMAALQQQADLLRGLQAGQTGRTNAWNPVGGTQHIPGAAGGGSGVGTFMENTSWWS